MSALTPLGLIAGNGMLPYRIIENLNKSERAVFALGILGEVADDVSANMDAWVGIGQLQLARDLMQEAGVRDVVIVGSVQRPNSMRAVCGWSNARCLKPSAAIMRC